MMQQRERLYQLDKPSLARDAAGPAVPSSPAIPPGWIGLEHCNLSPVQGQVLEVPHVLLHPEIGVALIDIAPGEAVGAEPAFRARLESARFAAIFPGELPIVHLQLQPEELSSLDTLLPNAFATLPRLSLPGGDGWVSVVRRALATRQPLRDGRAPPPEAAQDRVSRPPMLSREVAAQRAGLPPVMGEPLLEPQRARWPGLAMALGLAGVTALAAGAAVFWSGSQPAEPPRAATTPADRSGTQVPAMAATGGSAPAPALTPAPPRAVAGSPAAPPPAARDRAAAVPPAPPPRTPDPAPPAPPRALPPTPAVAAIPPPPAAAEPTQRLTVRAAANIRSSPNNKAPILRTAPRGEVLREFSRSPDDWVEVGDTRPQGWMYGKFLVPVEP